MLVTTSCYLVKHMECVNKNEAHPQLHERCGKSEEAHAVTKDDLAGGKLPSEDFGENAAW